MISIAIANSPLKTSLEKIRTTDCCMSKAEVEKILDEHGLTHIQVHQQELHKEDHPEKSVELNYEDDEEDNHDDN